MVYWVKVLNQNGWKFFCRSEEIEKQRLDNIAKSILNATDADELSVMAHFNGSTQFFGITAPPKEKVQVIYFLHELLM